MRTTVTSYRCGLLSEDRAARFLRDGDYHILYQRFKTPVGEIDLIAEKVEELVFVEVKFRRDMTQALETLSVRQQQRILAAAEYFLAENPCFAERFLRFDVIALTPMSLQHIENAFWKDR